MNITKELLRDMQNQDLSMEIVQYIISVVNYIDTKMEQTMNQNVIMEDSGIINIELNIMVGIVGRIQCKKTGIQIIDSIADNITEKAKQEIGQFKDFKIVNIPVEPMDYVFDYIASISKYGGLYKYVKETYTEEQIKSSYTTISIKENGERIDSNILKERLIKGLDSEELSIDDKVYIESVIEYIDSSIKLVMQDYITSHEKDIYKAYKNEMRKLAKKIVNRETGNSNIDKVEVSEHVLGLYNYIVVISNYGGLYNYSIQEVLLGIDTDQEVVGENISNKENNLPCVIEKNKFIKNFIEKFKLIVKTIFSRYKSEGSM